MIYLQLFWTFFKIGALTFGGGYAMIPLVQDAVVTNEWLTEEAFLNFIAVAESTPGPIAINMATYIGSVQGCEYYGAFGGIRHRSRGEESRGHRQKQHCRKAHGDASLT
jgi:chromate transport protein ChrA